MLIQVPVSTSCIAASPDAAGCPGADAERLAPWSAGWLLLWSGGLASRDLLVRLGLFGDTEQRREPASTRQAIDGEIEDVGFDDGMWPGAVTRTRLRSGMVAASSAVVSVNDIPDSGQPLTLGPTEES